MLICIKVYRELEDVFVFHQRYAEFPTREQVLEDVINADLNYEDDYGKIEYFQVEADNC